MQASQQGSQVGRPKLHGQVMKRLLAIAALLVALPLATAADCKKNNGDPAPKQSDHCVMTRDGCLSPSPRPRA